MVKRVSEKTLELNIVGEILERVRHYPGCQQAFWFGMTQRQEAMMGVMMGVRS